MSMCQEAAPGGQVPPASNSQFSDLPKPNAASMPPSQSQALRTTTRIIAAPDIAKIRQDMRHLIGKNFLLRKHPTPDMQPRMEEIARRLEELLYRNATTKEEYMNMSTLGHRLQTCIRHMASANQSQQVSHSVSSSSVGTVIPTPATMHCGNFISTVSSSLDNSSLPVPKSGCGLGEVDTSNTRSFLPTSNGSTGGVYGASYSSCDGPNSNAYQQPLANISTGSGGSNPISSTSLQRTTIQMMPTPGLNNTNANSETFSNTANISGNESTISSKPQQLKQFVGGQNRSILQNLSDEMEGRLRSTLPQKSLSHGFPNGAPNDGLGSIANNVHLMQSPAASERHLAATPYGCLPASPRLSNAHHDHPDTLSQQIIFINGDGHGIPTSDLSGPEKLYDTKSSITSTINTQIRNQTAHTELQTTDQSSKLNLQSYHISQQQMQKFQQQELQHQPDPSQRQFVQPQQNQDDQFFFLKNDENRLSQVTPHRGSQAMDEQFTDSHQYPKLDALQNQFQQAPSAADHSRGAQLSWNSSGQEDFGSSCSQNLKQVLNNQALQLVESQSQGQWHPQSEEKLYVTGQSFQDHNVYDEFHQRIKGQDEAQRPHCSSGSMSTHSSASRINITPTTSKAAVFGHGNATRNQIRWLLFLRHARRCTAPEGKCLEINCIKAQQLWKHMEGCHIDQCQYPRCHNSKRLIQHYKKCRRPDCTICIPVREYIEHIKACPRPPSDTNFINPTYGSQKLSDGENVAQLPLHTSSSNVEVSQHLHSLVKRMKVEHPSSSLIPKTESYFVSDPVMNQMQGSQDAPSQICQQFDIPMNGKIEITEVKKGSSLNTERESLFINETKKDTFGDVYNTNIDNGTLFPKQTDCPSKHEIVKDEKDGDLAKQKTDQGMAPMCNEQSAGTKSAKPKIKGVSLTELFTPDEIRSHIFGLRQWVGQSKAKAEKNQAMEHSMSENSCQLCAVERLAFEPPPVYCTSCGARIKRNAMFYTTGSGETRHFFCIPCYNESRGDTIEVDGRTIKKAKMEKKKNDEETEEWWVQCDKCEAWQHQICALFNGRRNEGGQAEYTCPNCYIGEIERGERKPLPQSAVLGAKDLPRTILSDHIEQRLFRQLKQERQDRARHQGKNYDEVPGAEALVVRVVSSVDKKLEVKQHFLEVFQEENYPTEFPYKSKVVLLFQKIEGVEVCLFGMYVQEFGSECLFPNQRRVYLSYLDSVKYFRPDIKTVTGEALRTFVYHEILIAYLDYCKRRGFTSCYIWACPPLKGEDYILYCHPEIQKTPKSDKLREWYLSMLRKASKENIVVDLTNLHDYFFISNGECKAKVTAVRLPYFDGDYWPGAAEDMINQLYQEEDGRKQQKKGKTKKIITKRALKAAGQMDLCANASKDILLMQKLGETIYPMKEDFIMVHLQHACTHCCHLMTSGRRWVCSQCKKFQLCDECYNAEQNLEEMDKHPINSRDKHRLHPVDVNDVPEDTTDKDEILESEFFDTRQAFLSLCQGNHYQYDTLRRAKHSSMMVLYHLHNPTAPAFVTTCNICHNDIETGQGWRCESCPDYDLCNSCYQKDGGVNHPHSLTNHPSVADRDAQNKEARQLRVLQLRKMLNLLVHASQCRFPQCPYPNCRKVKGLFRHGIHCKTKASAGCLLCKKMWYVLQLHARACRESECPVPRCKDLKEHLKRLQQQADSRRRAAVMEMMRQRAAEVAGNSG